MGKPKILDLYSCAGGAGMGYSRAGFDVYGVELDQARATHYPFPVRVGNALVILRQLLAGRPLEFGVQAGARWIRKELPRSAFAATHAPPPSQPTTALPTATRPPA